MAARRENGVWVDASGLAATIVVNPDGTEISGGGGGGVLEVNNDAGVATEVGYDTDNDDARVPTEPTEYHYSEDSASMHGVGLTPIPFTLSAASDVTVSTPASGKYYRLYRIDLTMADETPTVTTVSYRKSTDSGGAEVGHRRLMAVDGATAVITPGGVNYHDLGVDKGLVVTQTAATTVLGTAWVRELDPAVETTGYLR